MTILDCLAIIKEFSLAIYKTVKETFMNVTKFSFCDDETIRSQIVETVASFDMKESIDFLVDAFLFDELNRIHSKRRFYLIKCRTSRLIFF